MKFLLIYSRIYIIIQILIMLFITKKEIYKENIIVEYLITLSLFPILVLLFKIGV